MNYTAFYLLSQFRFTGWTIFGNNLDLYQEL